MLPLEVLRVESPDKTGAEAYESVIRDVLADLELTTVLGRLWVYIDPTEPFFIFCTLIRTGLPSICVKDMADISTGTPSAKQVELKLTNEEHVSTLLSILWIEYGRENVSQPERLVITIDTDNKDEVAENLADVVIADPRREIETRLADALLRITPEGFRVRHHVSTGSEMLFVASEDSIKPEWIKKAEDIMDQLKGDL
ncbi:MAG: methanogenesis marker 17 protein [Euryarchaeota archaeon]|nr:methanogenesis marker 17 protein [Euryarchaeota archaeon]